MSEIDFPSPAMGPANLLAGLGDLSPAKPRDSQDPEALEKASKDFEAVLLNQVLEEMDRSVIKSGLLDDGVTEQVQGMVRHYLSQHVAENGGLGLWKDIQRDMARKYAGTSEAPARPTVEHTS